MTLEFKDLLNSEERNKTFPIFAGALWLKEYIDREIIIVEELKQPATVLTFLTDLVLGDYTSKWFDPLIHTTLIAKANNESLQPFLLGKLRLLTLVEEFKPENKDELLEILSGSIISDKTRNVVFNDSLELAPQLRSALQWNQDYVRGYFSRNHWMLLLLFIVSSYQLLGYDKTLLQKQL